MTPVRVFDYILANSLAANITNFFVWFALTFWVFLETHSILATSLIAGTFAIMNAVTGLFFGAIVDHNKKKTVMLLSSAASLVLYSLGYALFLFAPTGTFADPASPYLWALVVILMLGSIIGNIRAISLTTLVSIMFTDEERPKVNGLVGTVQGITFMSTSILSGLSIAYLGMQYSIFAAVLVTMVVVVHLATLRFGVKDIVYAKQKEGVGAVDIKGTLALLRETPGIIALILFTSFNNFLGGVFMALMDSYALSSMSVDKWGISLAVLSTGFIIGGALIAKYGLGENPIRTLFQANAIAWTVAMLFTVPDITVIFLAGIFLWMVIGPVAEAAESTILQKVIPIERQGRTIGFAQTVEQMASPLTALFIGPLTHFFFIPFMTTGLGAVTIGPWFGTGEVRAMALVFTLTGVIGLVASFVMMRSRAAHAIEHEYQK
jgi:DHA3 family multidrug efflux protein-like MFS transporter